MNTGQLQISGSAFVQHSSDERSQKENTNGMNSGLGSPEPKGPKMIPEKVHKLEVAI